MHPIRKISYYLVILFSLFQPLLAQNTVVTDYSTTIYLEDEYLIHENYIKIKVNNRHGDWITNFQLPYSKLIELEDIEGYITDEFGNTIRKLKKKEITESSRFSEYTFYSDEMVKRFSLRHFTYPYYVVLSYTEKTTDFLSLCNWTPIYKSNVSTLKADIKLITSPKLKYKAYSRHLTKSSYKKDEQEIMRWKGAYKYKENNERFSPHPRKFIPYLYIIPDEFTFLTKGNTSSWQTFGDWFLSLCDGKDQLTYLEKIAIDKLTEDISDTTELITILYNYLQDNTRYINISIEHGGLVPYPATYVCENKYGECKALTNYMKALLKYKGIVSNFALVYAGDTYPILNQEIITSQFNHVILAVPQQQDTIWLECTSNLHPINSLGTFTQNRKCLFIDKGNSRLINTPVLTANECYKYYSYHFSHDTSMQTKVVGYAKLGADKAPYMRYLLTNNSTSSNLEELAEYIEINNIKLNSYENLNNNRNEIHQGFSYSGNCKTPFAKVEDFTRIYHPKLNIPYFEKPEEREYALELVYPLAYTDTLYYDKMLSAKELISEQNYTVDCEFGFANISRTINDTAIIVTRDYQIFSQTISPKKYNAFYDFITAIDQNLYTTIIK